MHPILEVYIGEIKLTDDIINDASKLLMDRGFSKTADHCQRVAEEAIRLAQRWGQDERQAEIAGWLHDISAIIPREHEVQVAESLNIDILAEERIAPVLIHQKLSGYITRELFSVSDKSVLSAIECHTTLKADCSTLDMIVFVADKIAWDQRGDPPYLTEMLSELGQSLNKAALCYLNYLWQRRDSLPTMHPWALQARQQLIEKTANL